MGGRGGAGGTFNNIKQNQKKSRFQLNQNTDNEIKKDVKKEKLPSYGPKVQSAYIDYVKKQINVDLSKARENRFDDRSGFNIDTRKLPRSQYSDLQRLAQKSSGDYDVQLMSNGANRVYIRVKRKKKR